MINELSNAIGFFESIIKESDKISADASPELTAKLAEHKEHLVVAVDAMILILSDPITTLRLKKQQDRSEGV